MNFKLNSLKNAQNFLPIISASFFKNEVNISIIHLNIILTLFILKNHIGTQAKILSSISGVDLFDKSYRFSVVYDLLSLSYNKRIRVKIFTNEITSIDSIVPVFKAAGWWEREIWDLFGIYFNNSADIRRILTDYGFEGHPLRKDFPLSGYIELKYNFVYRCITVDPVEFSQEYRDFSVKQSMDFYNQSSLLVF